MDHSIKTICSVSVENSSVKCSSFQLVGVSRVCPKIKNRELGKRNLELFKKNLAQEVASSRFKTVYFNETSL